VVAAAAVAVAEGPLRAHNEEAEARVAGPLRVHDEQGVAAAERSLKARDEETGQWTALLNDGGHQMFLDEMVAAVAAAVEGPREAHDQGEGAGQKIEGRQWDAARQKESETRRRHESLRELQPECFRAGNGLRCGSL
jgi:hypothetical protein